MTTTLPARARSRVWWYALGSLPITLLAMAVGLLLTGAATPSALFDPGPLVRWGLPTATVLTHAGAAVTTGAFVLCALVLPAPAATGAGATDRPARRHGREETDGAAWTLASRIGAVAAVVWALAQLAQLVLTHASVIGAGVGGPDYGAQLAQFVTEIELGRYLLWATALTALVAMVAAAVSSYTSAAWAAVLAVVAIFPVSLTGHAAGAASHELAVSAWWLHVAGVALWVGGLLALCLVAGRLGRNLPDAVERYSRVALWAFLIVFAAGAASAWIRLDSPMDLLTHPYGQLLLIKIVLTAGLGLAGWAHRETTIPAIRAHLDPGAAAPVHAGSASRATAGASLHAGATARARTQSGAGGVTSPGRAFWRLAGVEVLVMGAVAGVGVALGSSAPPVPQDPVTVASPVYLLTGYPEPPFPTASTYLTQWRPDPATLLVTIAAVVVYLRWVVRLRRRGDTWSLPRTASWLAGFALFLWVTNGGPMVYGQLLFSAHMLQHMLLVMVVPIFLVLGAPVTLALRALPPRRDGTRGPREWILALVHSRWAGFFSHPIVAAVNFAGSMVVFYYTPLFEGAVTTHVGHLLMTVHFTLAGYLFANVLIGVDPGPPRPAYPLRLVLLFATMAFHAFFGLSIIEMTSLLAADHFGWLGLSWGGGVDALADQEKGGAITWGIGELPTLALAVGVAISWARDDERTARRQDRKADRDEDADLRAYNAMLAARAQGSDTER